MSHRSVWFGATSAIALVLGGGAGSAAAQAQDTSQPTAAQLEEVVVTARRREEALRDVPIRIDAFGEEDIERLGIRDMQSLEQAIVGAEFVADNGNPFNNEIIIRGGGVGRFTNVDGGTGLYFNGINIMGGNFGGRSLSGGEQFDVSRYEVLKGPQGALYGRNALGGAINVISRQANTSEFGGLASIQHGSNQAFGAEGSLNIPVIEGRLGVRLAGRLYDQEKGFYYNPVRKEYLDSRTEDNIRLQVAFEPNESWSWRFQYDRYTADREGNIRYDFDVVPNPFIWSADDGNEGQQTINNYQVSGTGDLGWATFDVIANQRSRDSRILFDSDQGVATNPFDPTRQNACFSTVVMMVATTGPNQRCTELQSGVFDMSSIEARLSGATDVLDWIVGVDAYQFEDLFEQTLRGRGDASRFASVSNETNSWSAFGGLELQLTERLKVGAELRQTHEEKVLDTFSVTIEGPLTGTVQPLVDLDTEFDYNTWTLFASFEPTSNVTTFARAGSGFRSGGLNADSRDLLNIATGQLAVIPDIYNAERAISYEVGMKGAWWNRILTVDSSVYFVTYEDFLGNKNNGLTGTERISYVDNIGDAEFMGAEFLLSQAPINIDDIDISWSFGIAYMDGEITDAILPADQGLKITRVPEWSYTASLNLEKAFFSDIIVAATLSYAGQRGGFQVFNNTIALPDSDVFGFQVSAERGDWRLGLGVTNLTNTNAPIGARTAQGEARERDPRAFMLTLSRSFGSY